jgi:hypothetical protein
MNDRELLKNNINAIFEYYKNLEKIVHRFNDYLSDINANNVIIDKHSFKEFYSKINLNTSKINDKLISINYCTEDIRQTLEILDKESEDNL